MRVKDRASFREERERERKREKERERERAKENERERAKENRARESLFPRRLYLP